MQHIAQKRETAGEQIKLNEAALCTKIGKLSRRPMLPGFLNPDWKDFQLGKIFLTNLRQSV